MRKICFASVISGYPALEISCIFGIRQNMYPAPPQSISNILGFHTLNLSYNQTEFSFNV